MTRIERLASLLEEPLLVAGPPYILGGQANVRYLTRLASSNSAVLVEPDGSATLYTDFRYANRARSLGGVEVAEVARGLIPAIGALLSGRRIQFEEQHLPHALYRALVEAGVDAVPSSGLVEGLRAVKDAEEIAIMRRGSALSDEVFAALANERFSGRSERELAWWIERSFREGGAEGVSFEAVVAAGATAETPHAVPGDDPIEPGVLVTIDAGCVLFIRNTGTVGYPGSAEVVNMQPPDALIREGITSLPTIGDGRQSGTSASPSILNASPEAVVGGGLALLKTNDRVRVDLNQRTVNVLIPDDELAARRAAWTPPELKHQTPWQEIYRKMVGQLSTGGCLEAATLYLDIVNERGNPRHSH